jgi:serine protease Do
MNEWTILEAVERYISGQMNPDERVYFEQLRKTNPEIDQAVVEHTFFLQQMNRYDEAKKFKALLADTHVHLAEKGLIESPRLKGKARVAYLYNRYKRVAAIAASIAGITALSVSALFCSLPNKEVSSDYQSLNRKFSDINKKVDQLQEKSQKLDQKINSVADQTAQQPAITYKSGGTGFLIDNKGLLVTNAHVVEGARNIAVQNNEGKELKAEVVYTDKLRDLSIVRITDKDFKSPGALPYSFKKSKADIAEPIFTLGYPRNDIVYGEGYLSSKRGFNDDTLTCQITIAANRGNSGSPIFNKSGEVIGMLNAKQNTVEGAAFAIHAKYILSAVSELQKDTAFQKIKLPTAATAKGDRMQVVKKLSDYVFMVKVD